MLTRSPTIRVGLVCLGVSPPERVPFDSGTLPGATTFVDVLGDWQFNIIPSDVEDFGVGPEEISVTQTLAGTGFPSDPATRSFIVEAPPLPTINAITGDNSVAANEGDVGFFITGTGVPGATINLSFDSGTAPGATSLVDGAGNWFYNISPGDVASFGVGPEELSVTQTLAGTGFTSAPDTQAFNVVCFLSGTLINTLDGERPIESLQIGDLICTAEGPKPLRFLCRTSHNPVILWNIDALPVCIKAGALGDGLPRRDLYVSGGHAVLVDGHLIQASALVNGSTIIQTEPGDWDKQKPITYYNIELEQHELISAEGLTVESFYDILDRSSWDNYSDYLALYGSEQPLLELPLPRVNFPRQLCSALRQTLQKLEAALTASAG